MRLFFGITAALMLAGCSGKDTISKNAPIITGIAPIARLVESIGGTNFQVRYVIPAGSSPHTFALSPTDAAALERAAAVILVHPDIDGAILRNTPREHILVPEDAAADDHKNHKGHAHGINAHYWLSLEYSKRLAFKISAVLSELKPAQTEEFQSNAQVFAAAIDTLAADLKKQASGKKISALQQHSSWDFFLEELGIKNLGSVEQFEGDQISPARLVEVIKLIKAQPKVVLMDDAFTAPSPVFTVLGAETSARYLSFNPMLSEESSAHIIDILRSAGKRLLAE